MQVVSDGLRTTLTKMDGRFRGPPSPRPRFSGRSVSTNPTVAVSLSSRLTACSSGVQTR